MKNYLTHQVAIIGAGPYGLAAAAHLRAVGVETCIFGKVMEFWENQMPAGMFLRSSWEASSHFALDWSDRGRAGTRWARTCGYVAEDAHQFSRSWLS